MFKILILFLTLNLSCRYTAYLQNRSSSNDEFKTLSCKTLPFRFLITHDWEKSSNFRQITVFLELDAFNLDNLNTLFSYLSEKYPKPVNLEIQVKTDWSQLQLPLPRDCPGSGASGSNVYTKEIFKHHTAVYFRRGENVYFYYTTELNTEKMKKVVLSGNHQPKKLWDSE